MYVHEYHPGLSGLGFKSLKKKLKKVAKVAVHAGAAFMTGGASLAVTAAMLNAKKQKAAQAAADAAAAAQEKALIAQISAPQPAIAPAVVTPSAGGTMPVSVAPVAAPPPMYMTQPGDTGGQVMTMDTGGAKPPWLMPAALIGGGVLIAMLMRGGSKR